MEIENIKFVELFGRQFKIVRPGLEKDDVTSFIKELINERDALLKRQESLSTLTRLYEKTVIEADSLARQIQEEAKEQAQKEADVIVTKAKELAKVIVEQKLADATTLVEQRIKTVKIDIKDQLDLMLREQIEKIQRQIQESASQLSNSMIAQADGLIDIGSKFTVDFEQAVACKPLTHGEPVLDTETKAKTKEDGIPQNKSESEATLNVADRHHGQSKGESTVDIEILPPRDKDEMDALYVYIGTILEVKKIERCDMVDKTIFRVNMAKPFDILASLQGSSQIYEAKEIVKDGQKKIQVTLMVKAQLDTEKDKNNEKLLSYFSSWPSK